MQRSNSVLIALACIAASLFLSQANAQPLRARDLDGGDLAWFYNKPSVPLQQYLDDEVLCANLTSRAAPGAGAYGGGLVTGVFRAAMAPGQDAARRNNCMIVLGYRRFEIRPGDQREFTRRVADGGDDLLESYISAEQPPEGVLASQWRNEFLSASVTLQAAEDLNATLPTQRFPYLQAWEAPQFFVQHGIREIEAGGVLDPTLATIVVRTADANGQERSSGVGALAFMQIDPETGNAPLIRDVPVFMHLGERRRGVAARIQVFQAPPGRYVLWRYLDLTRVVDFCIGAPAFDVAAGDVVYAGSWEMSRGGPISVSMADEESVRAHLASLAPAAGLALRQAVFRNGARFPCSGTDTWTSLYGIRLPVAASE